MSAAKAFVSILACAALLAAGGAHAFKLQAIGPAAGNDAIPGLASRQAQGFLLHFTSDIHERITRQAYAKAGAKLDDDVIAGVRWNDNPPAIRIGALFGACNGPGMALMEGMDCWASMIRVDRMAWEAVSRREKGIAPLRSHFGDMQFLHAMATHSGDTAAKTRAKVLLWSEFAYRVARGEIGPRVLVVDLRDAKTPLDPQARVFVSDLFSGPAKSLWTVQDVFMTAPGNLRHVAFGTLLHTVEDSYSAAHVRRTTARVQANGCSSYDATDPILQFLTYAGQDTEKHGLCDDAPDWLETSRAASPIDVLAEITRAYEDGRDWGFVKAILEEKVFRLLPGAADARPGRCFEMAAFDPSADSANAPHPTALDPGCGEER
ncbi:MAG: hypothetical protein ACXWG6_01895 [Usitatibacter sp.]